MNLQSQLGNIASRENYIAESRNITKEEARTIIKNMSFGEYQTMLEANADKGNVGMQTTQSMDPPTPQNMNKPRVPDSAMSRPASTAPPASSETMDPNMTKAFDDAIAQAAPGEQQELEKIRDLAKTDPNAAGKQYKEYEGRSARGRNATSPISAFFNKMGTGMKAGFASQFAKESADLSRLRELAGISESATVGSTSAGNIASSPSIIGDTSDSHKPSVQLRKFNRLDREEEKNQDEIQDRKDTKQKSKSKEEDFQRLIKR